MKRNIINSGLFAAAILLLSLTTAFAKEKSALNVKLAYNVVDNNFSYLTLAAKTKVDGKLQPVEGLTFKLYLDKDSSGNGLGLIGKVKTNEIGKTTASIPPSLQQIWNANPNHTFIAISDATNEYEESNTEITANKAMITIDTSEDKSVVATVSEFVNGAWVPVKDVEMKLGVKRECSDLPIGDEATYTTDSLGKVTGEFKKEGLPGNELGAIVLVAKVEDNDTYGNLRVETTVRWGKPFKVEGNFFHRALWATRFHSPIWLVVMAYGIIGGVWGTVIYLILIMIRIKKAGLENQ